MQYWLIKSEPSVYSWDKFISDKKTAWEGVRNYAARNNLRSMKLGDLALFYHSNQGLNIVGIARVIKEHYQDPTTQESAWLSVDFEPFLTLKKQVSLEIIKKDVRLKNMQLIKISRLSVSVVTASEYETIKELGGINEKE